jgi:hypothetical protein
MDYMEQRSPDALQRQFATTRKGRTQPSNLREQILPENWPTIAAHEPRLGYQNRSNGKKGSQKSLTTIVIDGQPDQDKSNTTGKNRGQLNPAWVEQLMGLPAGWTNFDCLETE